VRDLRSGPAEYRQIRRTVSQEAKIAGYRFGERGVDESELTSIYRLVGCSTRQRGLGQEFLFDSQWLRCTLHPPATYSTRKQLFIRVELVQKVRAVPAEHIRLTPWALAMATPGPADHNRESENEEPVNATGEGPSTSTRADMKGRGDVELRACRFPD